MAERSGAPTSTSREGGEPPSGEPGRPPPPGWAQGYGPPAQPPPPPGWYPGTVWYQPPPRPPGPANEAAIAGFSLSVTGAALLLLSTGILAPLTLVLAILGIVFGRSGRRKLEQGETQRHGSLAVAAVVIGTVTIVLAVLAIAFWVLIIIVAITADGAREDLGPERLEPVRAALLAVRAGRA